MSELDVSTRIGALRSTFSTIEAVLDPQRLAAEIEKLSAQASLPDLWDDPDKAQVTTSALSHRQSELAKITDVAARLADLDVLVDMAQEGGIQTRRRK